jgi:hypothetical protein
MVLIVEDGTVVPNADSFLSLADARAMAANYGITLPEDDTQAEVDLRLGYSGLLIYEPTLSGQRVSAEQTGIYPRQNAYLNCFLVADDVIPNEVKLAQLYYAGAVTSGLDVNETDDGNQLASFEVVDVYKESYKDSSSTSFNTRVKGAINALNPLTKSYLSTVCGFGSGGGLYRDGMGYMP